MSYLGNEIRIQEQTARRIAAEMGEDNTATRRTIDAVVWQSTAGDAFRKTVQSLLSDLDACQSEMQQLADALADHAQTVEAHEKTLTDIAAWPLDQAKNAAGAAADTAHDTLTAFERGVHQLARVGS